MTWRIAPLLALTCVCLALPVASHAFDETAGKERIGLRVGGVATNDGFKDAYGGGWDLTLFFTERITHHFLLDVRLGAIYMGDLQLTELDDKLLNQPGIQSAMRLLFITLGPSVGTRFAGPYSMHLSGGAGIYSVSMTLDNALTPADFSDQNFGFNGAFGISRRIATNWSIDAETAAHYVLIKKDISDVYFAFTDGADAPLILDVTLGVAVDLR
jgi:opacity protein-like surface antigen